MKIREKYLSQFHISKHNLMIKTAIKLLIPKCIYKIPKENVMEMV